MRPGTTPGTKPWRAAHCCTKPTDQATASLRRVSVSWASRGLAKASSSRARATTSSMSGTSAKRTHGVGKGLQLLHEFGILDLVERPAAVGQLHAGLQLANSAARPAAAPSLRSRRPGPRCRRACCRHGVSSAVLEQEVAADGRLQRQRHHRVDQRVQARHAAEQGARIGRRRRHRVERRFDALAEARIEAAVDALVEGRRVGCTGRRRGLGARPAGHPPALQRDGHEHHCSQREQCPGQVHASDPPDRVVQPLGARQEPLACGFHHLQAASAIDTADSMSTATMR